MLHFSRNRTYGSKVSCPLNRKSSPYTSEVKVGRIRSSPFSTNEFDRLFKYHWNSPFYL